MIISDLTEKIPKFLDSAPINWSNVNLNCPLANLRAGFTKIKEYFDSSQGDYDALAVAVLNCDGLLEDAVEHANIDYLTITHEGVTNENDRIYISDDDAMMILSAFNQASDQNGIVKITGANGALYSFRTVIDDDETGWIAQLYDSGNSSVFLDADPTGYFIRTRVYPINFTPANVEQDEDEVINILLINNDATPRGSIQSKRRILGEILNEDIDTSKSILDQGFRVETHDLSVSASTISLFTDLGASATCNAAMSEICSACLSGNSGNQLQAIFDRYSNATTGVSSKIRNTMVNVKLAYASSGLRGVFSYLMNMFRSAETLTTSDGVLLYTDNSQYMPEEFIAGAFISIATTLINAISTILLAIRNVVTAILSIVGFIANALISAFQAQADATYASVLISDSLNDDSIVPYSVLSLFKGEVSDQQTVEERFSKVTSAIVRYGTPLLIPVVGGAIIVGPGSFDSNGRISTLRWEFHPSVVLLSHDWHLSEWNAMVSSNPRYAYSLSDILASIPYEGSTIACWNYKKVGQIDYDTFGDSLGSALYNHVMTNCNELTDIALVGSLNEYQDRQLRQGTALCCGLFLLCCLGNYYSNTSYPYIRDISRAPNAPIDGSSFVVCFMVSAMYWIALQNSYWDSDGLPFVPWSWSEIVNDCEISTLDSMTYVLYNSSGGTTSRTTPLNGGNLAYLFLADDMDYKFERDPGDYLYPPVAGSWSPIPANIHFGAIPPKWNASTFWKWTILASVVTVAAVAATAVISIKASQWMKRRRAFNKANFSKDQATFEQAVKGERSYVNEDGEIVTETFNPNSVEGKQYIKDCYSQYKRTAFKNNLWSNLVGGSRYDVGSFWGEKDSVSDTDIITNTMQSFAAVSTENADDPLRDSFNLNQRIYNIITGNNDSSE